MALLNDFSYIWLIYAACDILKNLIYCRYLLPLLLQYDSTAEESGKTETHGVGASVQIAKNNHAIRASQALSRLSGISTEENATPHNHTASSALKALLTPKLASMLKDNLAKELLSKLNSNLESPEVNAAGSCVLLTSFFFLNFGVLCCTNITAPCWLCLASVLLLPYCFQFWRIYY